MIYSMTFRWWKRPIKNQLTDRTSSLARKWVNFYWTPIWRRIFKRKIWRLPWIMQWIPYHNCFVREKNLLNGLLFLLVHILYLESFKVLFSLGFALEQLFPFRVKEWAVSIDRQYSHWKQSYPHLLPLTHPFLGSYPNRVSTRFNYMNDNDNYNSYLKKFNC